MHLEPGEQRVVSIEALPKWNDTKVEVRPDESYRLTAKGTWKDASIEAGPEGYTRDRIKNPLTRFFFRITEGLRRVPPANWFALILTVGRDLSVPVVVVQPAQQQPTVLQATRSGVLYGFANDLPCFYGNNKGFVSLKIERTR